MESVGPPAAKRCRFSPQPKPFSQTRSKKRHWLCNELVFEVCPNIPVMKTSEKILLTAVNFYAYLEARFRKKAIYRDAIPFMKLNKKKGIRIWIDQVGQGDGSGEHVVIDQHKSHNRFKLETNRVQLEIWRSNCRDDTQFGIAEDAFESAHVLYFVRLLAHLMQTDKLDLGEELGTSETAIASLAGFLKAQVNCFDWIRLSAERFLSEFHALPRYQKLQIHGSTGPDDWPQFCGAFTQWLASGNERGQLNKCLFHSTYFNKYKLMLLLDEIKADFSCATSKHLYAVRFSESYTGETALSEFTLRNAQGEELKFRGPFNVEGKDKYTLVRCPNGQTLEPRFEDGEGTEGIVLTSDRAEMEDEEVTLDYVEIEDQLL